MTNEERAREWCEARGFGEYDTDEPWAARVLKYYIKTLSALLEDVRAEERERCARVCMAYAPTGDPCKASTACTETCEELARRILALPAGSTQP